MFSTPFRRSLLCRPASFAPSRRPVSARPFHLATRHQARKDAQDKDSLKPQSNEYSKSGSDAGAAAVEDTAFDPNQTSPEEQERSASKEVGGSEGDNPLNVSPANQEVSQPRDPQEGGPEGSAAETDSGQSARERTSGGGSPKKSGSGQ